MTAQNLKPKLSMFLTVSLKLKLLTKNLPKTLQCLTILRNQNTSFNLKRKSHEYSKANSQLSQINQEQAKIYNLKHLNKFFQITIQKLQLVFQTWFFQKGQVEVLIQARKLEKQFQAERMVQIHLKINSNQEISRWFHEARSQTQVWSHERTLKIKSQERRSLN